VVILMAGFVSACGKQEPAPATVAEPPAIPAVPAEPAPGSQPAPEPPKVTAETPADEKEPEPAAGDGISSAIIDAIQGAWRREYNYEGWLMLDELVFREDGFAEYRIGEPYSEWWVAYEGPYTLLGNEATLHMKETYSIFEGAGSDVDVTLALEQKNDWLFVSFVSGMEMHWDLRAGVPDLYDRFEGFDYPVYNPAVQELDEDDFIVHYKGIVISDLKPFEELSWELGLPTDSDFEVNLAQENINLKAGGWTDEFSFAWYSAALPYIKNYEHDHFEPDRGITDMIVDYIVNETYGYAWLVSVRLINPAASTNRGLRVGDHEQEFLDTYGVEFNRYRYYSIGFFGTTLFGVEMDYPNKNISVSVDHSTNAVHEILIDYCRLETMELLDIPEMGW